VGSRWGRARGLIPIGLLLAGALAVASLFDAVGVPVHRGAGDRVWHPVAASQLRPSYELGAGQMTLDLRDVTLQEPRTVVGTSLGMGELHVVVPQFVDVVVEAKVGVGELRVLGSRDSGVGVRRTIRSSGAAIDPVATSGVSVGPRTLVVRAHVGMGEIVVTRATT
jgi:hypothetical protein